MNILLINHYAGSPEHGMEYRPYYLAREWVRLGHEVTIVAATFSHLRTRGPQVNGKVTTEEIDGIRYIWLKTPPYRENGPKRALNIFSFAHQLCHPTRWLPRDWRPDAVIASSTYPLDNIPAHRIARRSGAKLIYEVHDLWPLSPIELGGMSPKHPFILLMQWAENYAYRHADTVVSVLPHAESHMRAHGLAAGRFIHIPNGIDVTEWQGATAPVPAEHAAVLASSRAGASPCRLHWRACRQQRARELR